MFRAIISLAAFVVTMAHVAAAEPAVRLNVPANGKATIDVTGLDAKSLDGLRKQEPSAEQWSKILLIYILDPKADAGQKAVQLLRGDCRIVGDVIRFEPRYPLVEGLLYVARFDPAALGDDKGRKPITAELTLPKVERPPAVVERVYPSRDVLPENLLRFYIHFNVPMAQGQAYRHVKLLDGEGKPIDGPFLELFEELWDRDGKRFTLLIDPGRIKKGLKPREDLGPVLEKGKSYTLVVDAAWPDARGNPMKQEFRKTFRATDPVESGIDPKAWKVQPPAADSSAPLKVVLPSPLDNALMRRLIWVTDAKGQTLAGKVAVGDGETVWAFTPEKAWAAGDFNVVVETSLEDISGNRVGHPFEVDVLKPVQKEIESQTVKLPFTVKPTK